jgi:molybdopterin molybdotransferase
MSGFLEEAKPIQKCLDLVAEAMRFPWDINETKIPALGALGRRCSKDITAPEPSPRFTRSLRDGYAVAAKETTGASVSSPVFLELIGEVAMGETPSFSVAGAACALVPTGGALPEGADAVVMLENAERAGGWVEIRKAVQSGENIAFEGEEIKPGGVLVSRGDILDCRTSGSLAAFGVTDVDVFETRIGIVSTGDEIVPAGTSPVPRGFIRDSNAAIVQSVLRTYGFGSRSYGITRDDFGEMKDIAERASRECDAVIFSGGSSAGARDHTARVVGDMGGVLVHGINIVPGKPTIIGGSAAEKKLFAGLPGHPLSCMTVTIFVLLPLLLSMIGARAKHAGKYLTMPLVCDVQGRNGPEEFIPARFEPEGVRPLAARSGYVSALAGADGFIVLPPEAETKRAGEAATVWTW